MQLQVGCLAAKAAIYTGSQERNVTVPNRGAKQHPSPSRPKPRVSTAPPGCCRRA